MSKYDADSRLHCQGPSEGEVVARGQHPAVVQVQVQGAGRVVLEGGEGRGGNEELHVCEIRCFVIKRDNL